MKVRVCDLGWGWGSALLPCTVDRHRARALQCRSWFQGPVTRVKRRKRRNALRDRRLNDLRSAARPTRSTGTDASVTFRPLILTPARWENRRLGKEGVL